MTRTDVADVRDNVTSSVKDSASAALDTARAQAASAGESLSSAASSALATASEQSKRVQKHANDLSTAVQKRTGRKPRHRGRKFALIGGLLLAAGAVGAVVRRRIASAPQPGTAPESTVSSVSSNGNSAGGTGTHAEPVQSENQ